ncbi:MAG: PF20097 family protein [Phycisphaerales bacterium]
MAHKPMCLVCKKEMELGFMTDRGDGNSVHLPRWCAGEPQKPTGVLTIAGDAKQTQLVGSHKVTAYRCPECHALRLYAFDS